MRKKNIIAAAAVAAASIAVYFIRKKNTSRQRGKTEPSSGAGSRHMTDAFANAKTAATNEGGMP